MSVPGLACSQVLAGIFNEETFFQIQIFLLSRFYYLTTVKVNIVVSLIF